MEFSLLNAVQYVRGYLSGYFGFAKPEDCPLPTPTSDYYCVAVNDAQRLANLVKTQPKPLIIEDEMMSWEYCHVHKSECGMVADYLNDADPLKPRMYEWMQVHWHAAETMTASDADCIVHPCW